MTVDGDLAGAPAAKKKEDDVGPGVACNTPSGRHGWQQGRGENGNERVTLDTPVGGVHPFGWQQATVCDQSARSGRARCTRSRACVCVCLRVCAYQERNHEGVGRVFNSSEEEDDTCSVRPANEQKVHTSRRQSRWLLAGFSFRRRRTSPLFALHLPLPPDRGAGLETSRKAVAWCEISDLGLISACCRACSLSRAVLLLDHRGEGSARRGASAAR